MERTDRNIRLIRVTGAGTASDLGFSLARALGLDPASSAVISFRTGYGVADELRRVGAVLDQEVQACVSAPVVALFLCSGYFSELSLESDSNEGKLAAALCLAFPDIHWILAPGHSLGAADPVTRLLHAAPEEEDLVQWGYDMGTLLEANHVPDFDPGRLREFIRSSTAKSRGRGGSPASRNRSPFYVGEQGESAVSIDEEAANARFVSYCNYRAGRCSWTVTSLRQYSDLFGTGGFPQTGSTQVEPFPRQPRVFEDYGLRFPDDTLGAIWRETGPISIRERIEQFPGLERSEHFVLSAMDIELEPEQMQGASPDLRKGYENGLFLQVMSKPVSGILGFLRTAGLPNLEESAKRHFQQPSGGSGAGGDHASVGAATHSCPGLDYVISDFLLMRAGRIDRGESDITRVVRGAVFSLDALRLLGNSSWLTAVRAIWTLVALEVRCECLFAGSQTDLCVKSRLEEIDHLVYELAEGATAGKKQVMAMDALHYVVNRAWREYHFHGQYLEATRCNRKLRDIERTLRRRSELTGEGHIPTRRAKFVFFCKDQIRRYLNYATHDPFTLVKLCLWQFAAFSLAFILLHRVYACPLSEPFRMLLFGCVAGANSFFGHNVVRNDALTGIGGDLTEAVSVLAIVSGYGHLALFASSMYARLSRER